MKTYESANDFKVKYFLNVFLFLRSRGETFERRQENLQRMSWCQREPRWTALMYIVDI